MSKTKEVCVYIAPMIAVGLLVAYATGALPAPCLLKAATVAAVQMAALLIAASLFDASRSSRAPSASVEIAAT
jgi:hypothetical protein